MSTKTTFKRIALVTVAALGFGMLSTVTPANAAVATTMAASVGPNGETSLTVVGTSVTDTVTGGALIRIDVTSNDTATAGLSAGESITGTVIAVPTAVTAKTLAANGGSLADTTVAPGSGYSDFVMLESAGQTSGVRGATAAAATSVASDWSKVVSTLSAKTNLDTGTSNLINAASAADGVIGSLNTGFVNKDLTHETAKLGYVKSYYVTIHPRSGSNVMDQGAYTFQFQLVDANQVVRSTKTVKIDFVSAASKSDAVLTLNTSGNFLLGTAITTYDTQTGASAGPVAYLTLKNRDGGLVRTQTGTFAPAPLVTMQTKTTAAPTYVDSLTMTASDGGSYGADYGTDADPANGSGTLLSGDGTYGLVYAANAPGAVTDATTGRAYQLWAGYGNATIVTKAVTVYGSTTDASYLNTDAIVTASGMVAADQLLITNDSDAKYTWTLPTSTKSGTIKFYIQNSYDTAVAAADITVTPTWSGTFGTGTVTPATSTTGTTYTTDSTGLVTVSFTNDAPVAGATLTLALTGAKAFGNNRYVATITWAKPTATSLAVVDPITGVYVKTGSTNVTTVIVKDQFGNPVSGEVVTIALSTTSANYSATTTIAPITTGAAGTATYSLVGGATTATLDAITFTSVTSGATAAMTYNYVSTVPAVATMSGYYGYTGGTGAAAATLVPATGIYASGTTKLSLATARNISSSLASVSDSASDDMVALKFYALASGSVAATGAVVTVTAGDGGWILDTNGLPAKSRNFLVASTGYTPVIQALATKPGDIVFTATSGTVTSTATLKVANASTDGRFVTIANSSGTVTASVKDRYGNGVAGATVQISTSNGTLGNGQMTTVYTTDLSGNVAVLPAGQGDATITAVATSTGDYGSLAGYVGSTIVDSTVAAGNTTASLSMTLATASSVDAIDAANEATDAANAATDAANAAAEAADAATAAAQDAQAAVAALASQVADLIAGIKAQITALTNLVIKIQKKVKA